MIAFLMCKPVSSGQLSHIHNNNNNNNNNKISNKTKDRIL